MDSILHDIEQKLGIKISKKDIKIYSDGTTDASVFSIQDKYLIKCSNELELNVYKTFLANYKNEYYQKLYYINYDLGYMCLSFIKGTSFNNNLEIDYIVKTLYNITSNYKKIEYDGFGYLYEDHKTWEQFLKDEVDAASKLLKGKKIDVKIVKEIVQSISKYSVDQYLLHGDFGTHNFIVNNGALYIIDPMGLIGDPVYDFYFSVFSDDRIFTKIDFNQLLQYFDKDINYKKSIMIITFFIRLCRAYKYNKERYDIYLEYFNRLLAI